jgi:hypothetical protein
MQKGRKPEGIKCKPATYYSETWQLPVDRYGNPIRLGYRLCKALDCIEPSHITQSRFIAKRLYGSMPKLHRGKVAVPVSIELLMRIAKPTDKTAPPESCQVPECLMPHRGLGLCNMHHNKLYRFRAKEGRPQRIRNDWSEIQKYVQPAKGNDLKAKERFCHYPDCDREYLARGLCRLHHKRWMRWEKEQLVRKG